MDLPWVFQEPRGNSGQGKFVNSETMAILNANRSQAGPFPGAPGLARWGLGAYNKSGQEQGCGRTCPFCQEPALPWSPTLQPQMRSHSLIFILIFLAFNTYTALAVSGPVFSILQILIDCHLIE